MREILFRGKIVNNGKWAYGCYATWKDENDEIVHYIYEPCGIFNRICADTVGQYTGLNDKYKKPIFEGDIVKFQSGRICKITWFSSPQHCGYDLVAVNGDGCPPCKDHLWDSFVIIGNVHDNPELLTEKGKG